MSNTYLEPDRQYVAKQFNGPVVSGIIKAVYSFFHKDIDAHTKYFKELSIATADTPHLYFIGKLMGVQLFNLFSDSGGQVYLMYTDKSYLSSDYGYDNGWAEDYSEHVDGDGKGVFATGAEHEVPFILTKEQYQKILEAISQIRSASVDSVIAIDTLVRYTLDSTDYIIEFNAARPDLIDVTVGNSVPIIMVNALQSMYDKLFAGGEVNIKVISLRRNA